MFNIDTTVSKLIAAEKVNNSRNLTDEEKLALLMEISVSLMPDAPGCPEHAKIICASIQRMTINERANIAAREAKAGKTSGVEDTPEVAEGRAEESAEEAEGETSGVEELSEDDRGPDARSVKASASARSKRKAKN